MKKIGIAVLTACLLVSLACFVACSTPKPVLSAKDGITTVMPGETLEFSVSGVEDAGGVTFRIAHGGEFASIDASTGVLTVKADAKPGSTVLVYADYYGVSSDMIEITVADIPLTAITASASSAEIARGGKITLTATVEPSNATVSYEWKITEGEAYAEVSNGVLSVSESAAVGATVKVKAVWGTIESNELSFTVKAAENVMISFKSDEITIDKNDSQATKNLVVRTYKDGASVTDLAVDFEIVSGGDYVELVPDGLTCALKAKAHGVATVKASVPGTNASEIATVNVIVPPDSLRIASAFESRNGFNFSFGLGDELDFPVSAVGTGVCSDFEVTFSNEAGESDLATYNDGKIKFKKQGLITVTATSKSGSKLETKTSYTFDVNDGKNLATFEEIKNYVKSAEYDGGIVNIVNYETDTLIPELVKTPKDGMNLNDLNEERIVVTRKDFRLKGNGYTIDTSKAFVDGSGRYQALIEVNPYSDAQTSKSYVVEISDLNMVGNNGYQSDDVYKERNGGTMYCRNHMAIRIGNDGYHAVMYPTVKNVQISGFYTGMRVNHAVNGLIENVTLNDCYSNGIELAASKISVKDVNYKNCGAFGIEMTPEACSEAGMNFDEPQQVTFLGTTVAESDSSKLSPYMAEWMGGVINTLLQKNMAMYPAEVLNNFKAADGKMIFYALRFNNTNTGGDVSKFENKTQFVYGNRDDNFTIEASALTGKDTTHRFILLDVLVDKATASAFGLPVPDGADYIKLGQVVFINLNYVG